VNWAASSQSLASCLSTLTTTWCTRAMLSLRQ
jgi:hypothetical protein